MTLLGGNRRIPGNYLSGFSLGYTSRYQQHRLIRLVVTLVARPEIKFIDVHIKKCHVFIVEVLSSAGAEKTMLEP